MLHQFSTVVAASTKILEDGGRQRDQTYSPFHIKRWWKAEVGEGEMKSSLSSHNGTDNLFAILSRDLNPEHDPELGFQVVTQIQGH